MKLRQIAIAGFRGFNDERVIEFDERLTLIAAPNSHGKTSITEALEFLLYGATSKVDQAKSKEEFKDSYRNRHYPAEDSAYVKATFERGDGTLLTLRTELLADGTTRRFVDGVEAESWPFAQELPGNARPFVVQHALKDLLLAAPSERFQGFARLLGLNEIDRMQQALVNICTKPEANVPSDGARCLAELTAIEGRLAAISELQPVVRDLKRGAVDNAYTKIRKRAETVLGTKSEPSEMISALVAARDKATSSIYEGNLAIKPLSSPDTTRLARCRSTLSALGTPFLEKYVRLATADATERLRKEGTLLALGLEFLVETPSVCPLCLQTLDTSHKDAIAHRHEGMQSALASTERDDPRAEILQLLKNVESSVEEHAKILDARCADLIATRESDVLEKIRTLLGPHNDASVETIRSAANVLVTSRAALSAAAGAVECRVAECRAAMRDRREDLAQAEELTRGVSQCLNALDEFSQSLDSVATSVSGPANLLTQAVDAAAGTAELTLLVDLLDKRSTIEKAVRIRNALNIVRELKKHVDQAVGEVMEATFSAELTQSVMAWYGRIKTSGDPDVHFSGFSMDKTKAGDYKNRRVRIGAQSYGVDLASAVSSLSESKLNALGLCVSIATALRAPGPWNFLVLDDPIQSWDADHETQFINVIRSLAEQEGKQVILLSHRHDWMDQAALGCRSLNGIRYCITGYTKDGPRLTLVDWASIDQRLREALAVAVNENASLIQLQQAEGEIRIAAGQIVASIAKRRLKRERSAHNMNKDDARAILIEAACPTALIDRVAASFGTTDKAHHVPKDYQPNAQRIRQYHGALTELKGWLG